MKRKIRFRSPILDFFVTVLCLSVSGFFVFLFWKDLNHTARRTDKDNIATITFKNKIAQRKFEDRVVWERLAQSSPLYNGDLVRTSDLSEAVITFNDGSVLDLYENTMIQVYYSETEGVNVSVDGGSVQIDSSVGGKASLALSDGSVVKVESGASLGAKTEKGAQTSVQVKSGNASLTTESGSSSNLSGGMSVSVSEKGEIKKAPLTVTSIPQEMRVLNVDGGKVPVLLEWAKSAEIENSSVVVEVSRKKDFSEVIEKTVVSAEDAKNAAKNLNLESGSYYWKVFPKDMPEKSVTGKVTVEGVEPVVPLSPAKGTSYASREASKTVDFNWNGNKFASSYNVKVSKTADMKNPVIEKNVENTSIRLELPSEGTWWWNVTPVYKVGFAGEAKPSAPVSFETAKIEKIRPPVLYSPADAAKISYKESPSVNFLWKSDLKDSSYVFELSKSKAFSDLIFSQEMDATQKKLDFPEALVSKEKGGSTFWWRVTRKSTDVMDTTPVSEIHSFTLEAYVPEENRLLYPPESFAVEKAKLASLEFIWKKADDYPSSPSVMQLSRSKDFARVEREIPCEKSTLSELSLSEGTWWWRVGSVTEDKTVVLPSEPRRITVLGEMLSPKFMLSDSSELLTYKNSPVKFSWSTVSGADFYNVRVYDKDGKLISEKPEVFGKTADFTLPPSTYKIRLASVASQKENSPMRQSAWSELNFTVREVEPLTLLAPSKSAKIDGLEALTKPVTFTWQPGKDSALTYQLVLKKRQKDGSFKTVSRIDSSKMSASINRLSSGEYTWEVLASTAQGFPINSVSKAFE